MNGALRPIALVLVLASLVVALAIALTVARHSDHGPAPMFNDDVVLDTTQVREHVEEDDPRWDCRTMGNQICGPTQSAPAER